MKRNIGSHPTLTLVSASSSYSPTPSPISPSLQLRELLPVGGALRPTTFPMADLRAIFSAFVSSTSMPKGYHVSSLLGKVEASDGMQGGMEVIRIWNDSKYQDVLCKKSIGSDVRLYQLIEEQARVHEEKGIVPLYGASIAENPDDFSFCMMPLISGGNLKKYLPIIRQCLQGEEEALKQGALWFLFECIAQVSQTLDFLHTTAFDDSNIAYATVKDGELQHLKEPRLPSPIVHCDVKAGNILVDIEASTLQFKLIDFGASRSVARLAQDVAYEGGSRSSFSPARWTALAGIESESPTLSSTSYDIWALGLLLAEAMGIDCANLLPCEEDSNYFGTMSTAAEYLAGRQHIVIDENKEGWYATWKKNPPPECGRNRIPSVDAQEFNSRRAHCAQLSGLLQHMLSTDDQIDCPLPAAAIMTQCRDMIQLQALDNHNKLIFLKYLRSETEQGQETKVATSHPRYR